MGQWDIDIISLGTVLQLIWHISGLFDTRYQMSVCDDGKGGA